MGGALVYEPKQKVFYTSKTYCFALDVTIKKKEAEFQKLRAENQRKEAGLQKMMEQLEKNEQAELICSHQPIVALAGDDVILSCLLEPAISASFWTVEWTKPGLDPEYIHVHQDGRLVHQSQNPSYYFRTRLFVDELINGNVSMKIFTVKISDAGKYKCFLPSIQTQGFIQLIVGAVSTPVIKVISDNSRVVLQCESKGWYPEPEVFWLDGEGNLLSAEPTETVRGPDDLYTVSSRVTVKRQSNNVTCRVQHNSSNQTRETHIHVPGDFIMVHNEALVHWIAHFPLVIFVGVVLCRQTRAVFRQYKKKR
ncbi:butyrophilin subfamily 1 member A1-like [Thunnus maccoyii]|uniref:butyrophilin subfamily 1 member A1-like n=1 Tax=Thunnus maccoyii TaxID=8240 RepID=UPI001C4AE429|nr:butyrophilin subfamily 1 member A1-like [Thunnus maccoyii]